MSVIVIGLGNTLCGDDGVGGAVIDRLPAEIPKAYASDGLDLIDAWSGYDHAIVVDAMITGQKPGSVQVFDGFHLPAGRFLNTHSMGLNEAVSLARLVGLAPGKLDVVGIEGRNLGPLEPMSAEVFASLPLVLLAISALITSGVAGRKASPRG